MEPDAYYIFRVERVKDYIILYSTYHNPKQFQWVVELVDQPAESGAFCQFLEFAK